MNQTTLLFLLLIIISSCKSDKKENISNIEKTKTFTVAQKIAYAHGYENWKHVSQIDFTFNVDKDSSHSERSWSWNPKTNDVVLLTKKDTIHFNRKNVDSLTMNSDKAFINDKYWLLAPFQLVWDSGTTISEPIKEKAPISKTMLNKITLTYNNNGGYTPGDAYDFYYGDDYLIKEWVFRKGNSKTASLSTTWENYQDFNGIKLALDHSKSEGDWKLHFTNIKVTVN